MINKKAKAIKKTVIKSRIMFENHKDSLFNNKIILLNLIENQQDIDKIYLYAKDPYEAKYQYLIKIREKVGIDHHNDPSAYIEYSNDMRDVYKNINYYNPNKENKILVFDDMIFDMINNRNLGSIVTDLFIRGRKLDISLVFITQSYFQVTKDVRLNTTHFENRECTAERYSFLVNNTKLASDNPLRFRKLFLKYNKNHDN